MIMADDLYESNPGEAPDDNMPMDPTNYAISQNLGVPADGSITIVRDFDENKDVPIRRTQYFEKKIQLRIGAIKKSISGNRRMGNYDYIK